MEDQKREKVDGGHQGGKVAEEVVEGGERRRCRGISRFRGVRADLAWKRRTERWREQRERGREGGRRTGRWRRCRERWRAGRRSLFFFFCLTRLNVTVSRYRRKGSESTLQNGRARAAVIACDREVRVGIGVTRPCLDTAKCPWQATPHGWVRSL